MRRVMHMRRGITYGVLGKATICISKDESGAPSHSRTFREGEMLTVYVEQVDGEMFVRLSTEFEDGRFHDVMGDES